MGFENFLAVLETVDRSEGGHNDWMFEQNGITFKQMWMVVDMINRHMNDESCVLSAKQK